MEDWGHMEMVWLGEGGLGGKYSNLFGTTFVPPDLTYAALMHEGNIYVCI